MLGSRGIATHRLRRPLTLFTIVAVLLGWQFVGLSPAVADGPTSFSNTTSIAIPATGSANQMGPASPYPSDIAVSGLAGAVSKVTVTFSNLTHSTLNDIDALVVAPTGQSLVVLSDVGDPTTLAFVTNKTLTFDDAASGPVPTGNVPSGTYKPTNINNGVDTFPSPAPAPSSQTTLAGAFTGINPNGTWHLYAVDDTSGDIGVMAGGWSLTVTTDVAAVATTTTVTTSNPTTTTGNPVTFTATVKAGATAVTSGTVQFADGATNLGAPVALNGSGQAALTTSALTEGTHAIRATYSGATGFLTSNGSVSQQVDNATVVTGTTFCNPGALTVPTLGPANPYPSHITVSGLSGQVISVTAQLKGLSHQAPLDLDIMLAGPTPSKNLLLMSDAGGQNAVSNLNLTFDDAAAGSVPVPAVSGTFKPTNFDDGSSDVLPAPAPANSGATTLSTFAGASANGQWSLWVNDDASGDSGSIASGWCLTIVSKAPTTTSVTSSSNPSNHGSPVTLTATVASGGSPATAGTVQFADGATPLGAAVTVAANGTAALTTSALTVGSHPITATYSGSDTLTGSVGSLTQVVNKAPTTTALTSGTNPADVGAPVQLTATVTSGGAPATTGTVQFADGATPLGAPVALAADGTATTTTSALTAGTHTITATYSGDANLATSTDSLQQVVNQLVTVTTITSAPNPSSFGASVTLTATVTSGGAPVTSGSVQFFDGATSLGASVPLAADGTAQLSVSALAVGTHVVRAAYGGSATYAASSGTTDQVVDKAATSTTVTAAPNPSQFGGSVTITATVTSGGAPVTSGTVQFSDGATDLGAPVAVAADGTATLTTSALTVGSHTLTAAYQGTTSYAASTGTVDQVVDKATTTTALTSNTNPSTLGDPVQLTATVTSGGAPVTSGTVQFTDGATPLGAAVAVAADGTASISTMDLTVGSHAITATYSGSDTLVESSDSLTQVVDKATTTTTVTSGTNPSTHGTAVTFTATVTSGGTPVTTGTVQFADGATPLGAPVPVAAGGIATLTTSALTVGSHDTTATFSGDANLAGSAGTVTQVVNLAPTLTTLTSSTNPSALGDPVTFTATVTSNGAPVTTGTVEFRDEGNVMGGPVTVASDGTATLTTSTLTVGSHNITAAFSGDANLATSGDVLQQDVGKAATATALTSSLNPSQSGESVTFTATVTSGGTPVTTGTVQFADGATALGGPATVAADGTASLTTSALTVGTHAITATYSGTADLATSTGSLSQVVDTATTTTTVTSNLNPSTVGAAVQLTATVTAAAGPVTTGTVQFTDGATPLGAAVTLAADGTATFSTSALTVGTHTVTATYSGDATLSGSTGTLSQVVDKATTTTALASNSNPSTLGDPVQLTATVTSGIGTVTTGTVQFADGATPLGAPVTVAADGTAVLSTMTLTVGSHTITATYSGTDTLTGSSDSLTQVVDKATTTTTVTASPNPSQAGGTVTFTATVTSGIGPVSTGTVQFTEGATPLGSPVTVAADGTATLTTSALTVGSHTVTATFSGDANLAGSAGTVTQVVDLAPTITVLTSSTNPSALGDAVTFTATVTSGGSPVATGTVQFRVDGNPLGAPVPVAADGTATATTSTLTVGSHGIAAAYSGDANLATSGDVLQQDVGKAATATALTSSLNPSQSGESVTFTATVTSGGSAVTTGTVQFADGATDLGAPVTVAADGTATLTTSALTVGTHAITATYSGTADLATSTGSLSQVVDTATTTTTVTSSLNPSTVGAAVQLTATVTAAAGPVSTGTVQFADGATPLGAAVAVAADGTATFSTSALTVGTHTVTATYSGDATFSGSTGTVSQVVDKATTTTALASNSNLSTLGDPVQLTATVTSGIGIVTTGTVQFADGATPLGAPVTVAADGTAVLSTMTLAVGSHAITATYSGSDTLTGSSDTLTQVVDKATTTTTVTASPNPSQAGGTVTFTATVTSGIGPVGTGTVQFTDGGTPLGSPMTVAANGTATLATAALTVGTHTITATYSGNPNLLASTADVQQIVDQATTTTTLTSDTNPSTLGDPVQLTATVTTAGATVNTGTVQLTDGATPLGAPLAVAADGTATLTTSALTVGSHTITATYSGDADLTGSSGTLTQVVDQATTTTTVTSDNTPSTVGDPVQLTATVTSGGAPVTTGSVQLTDGATALGAPIAVAADGTATLTTSALTVGSHTITATYSGTGDLAGSAGTVTQLVDAIATSTTLTSSPNPATLGQGVTFTATVTAGGAPVGAGDVVFVIDGVQQPAVAVAADGTAALTTTTLAPGSHPVTAAYSGTDTYAASLSPVVQQGVLPVADAGGPYTVAEGGSLTLDGSASTAGATYAWDLNGDGDFTDATGAAAVLTWAQLEALGIDNGPSTQPVAIRVTLGSLVSTATATLDVTNTAPTSVITGSLTATVGVPFTVKVGADDPSSADMAGLFTYTVDWGDGSPVLTVVGPADPPVTHTYTTAGSFAASFNASDQDGGTGDPTAVEVVATPATTTTTTSTTSTTGTTTSTTATGTSSTTTTSGEPGTTSTQTTPPLAHTGADVLRPLLLAALLVLLGAGCLLVTRRRAGRHG